MAQSMFNLENFRESIKTKGIGRNNRFELLIFPPDWLQAHVKTSELALRCHQGMFPPFNVNTVDYKDGQGQFKMMPNGFDQGHKLDFSFYTDAARDVYNSLLMWSRSPFVDGVRSVMNADEPPNYALNYFNDYAGKVQVCMLNERDEVVSTAMLEDAYPVSVHQIQLDSSEHDLPQIVTITIAYRYATINTDLYGSKAQNQRSQQMEATEKRRRKMGISVVQDTTNEPDPSMVNIAKPTKEQSIDAVSSEIIGSNTVISDRGQELKTQQTAEWNSLKADVSTALASGNKADIDSARAKMEEKYAQITTNANGYFADTTNVRKQYKQIKGDVTADSPVTLSMNSMESMYGDVVKNQQEVIATYNSMTEKLNKASPPTITINPSY